MAEKHTILGGKVCVYQRDGSPVWQCATYLDGKNRRVSTKEKSLGKAKDFAEDWYLRFRQLKSEGILSTGKTFAQTAKRFSDEYDIMTEGNVTRTTPGSQQSSKEPFAPLLQKNGRKKHHGWRGSGLPGFPAEKRP
ncbi:MAG: hypothetical protein WBN04_21335 [Paracoccaceae bacterium]